VTAHEQAVDALVACARVAPRRVAAHAARNYVAAATALGFNDGKSQNGGGEVEAALKAICEALPLLSRAVMEHLVGWVLQLTAAAQSRGIAVEAAERALRTLPDMHDFNLGARSRREDFIDTSLARSPLQ
jgi:hypothetical protein